MTVEASSEAEVKGKGMTTDEISKAVFAGKLGGEEEAPVEEANTKAKVAPKSGSKQEGEDEEGLLDEETDLLSALGVEDSEDAESDAPPVEAIEEEEDSDKLIDGVDEDTIKSMNAKQGEAFKLYREANRNLKKQLKEAAQNKPSMSEDTAKEIEALKAKLEEKDGILKKKDFVESDYFKNELKAPIVAKGNELDRLGKELDIKDGILLKAARMGLGERLKYLDQNIESASARQLIITEFKEFDALVNKSKKAVENWREESQKAETTDTYNHNHKVSELQEKYIDNAVVELGKRSILMRDSKNPKIKELRTKRIEMATELIKQGDVAKQTQAVLKGVYADELETMYMNERKRRIQLEKDMGKFKKASPRVGGSSGGSATKKDVDLNNIGATVIDNLLAKKGRR